MRSSDGAIVIQNEIANDPAERGYAGQAIPQIVALANTPIQVGTTLIPLPMTTCLQWTASGPFQQIKDYADDTTNNAQLRSICLAALATFGVATQFGVTDPSNSQMITVLVSSGILTQTQVDALIALATVPLMVARSITVLGDYWDYSDVEQALNFIVNQDSADLACVTTVETD
jgi:hypothetical protein